MPAPRTSAAALALTLATVLARPPAAGAQFALRGGINLSKFVGGDAESDARAGLNLGGSFRLLGLGPIAIRPELYYAQKGADRFLRPGSGAPGPTRAPVEVSLDYVEVPVLAVLSLAPAGARIRPYVMAGPAFAWKLNCKISSEPGSSLEETCADLFGDGLEEKLKDYQQGLVFGGGLDLFVLGGLGALNLDARVVRGLSGLTEEGAGPAELKSQTITLMLGYSVAR